MDDLHSSGTVPGDRIAYLGGRNVVYDLSGSDPNFYCGKKDTTHPTPQHSPDQIVIFEPNQVHSFQIPVFLDSIIVEKRDDEENKWVEVRQDPSRTDGWFMIDQDTAAMSQAYLLDRDAKSAFSATLVSQIQFNLLATGKTYVRISYQRFYMDLYDFNKFDGVGPSYTPALGKYLLDTLADVKNQISANIANTFAVTDTANDMLPEDLTGRGNYVQEEQHEVNTSTGLDTIMPARGSFYSHDLRIWKYTIRTGTVQMANKKYNLENQAIFIYNEERTIGSTTSKTSKLTRVYLSEENYDNYIGLAGSFIDRSRAELLIKDKDYEITNLNVAKTEKSSSEYGVYDTIRMLTSFTGNIMISYHAFGGAVVFEDMRDMRQDLLNTMSILNNKNILTADVLDKQPILRDLTNRIQRVEQYHNHFGQVEHAVYFGSTGFHWINIAELYDVAWGEDLDVVDEIGKFRVESRIRKWCYEFVLSIDLKQKLANMLRCKTLATNDVAITDLTGYVEYFNKHDDVAVRVCWCGDGTKSGLMLQLGWSFDNYEAPTDGIDTDTITVTNLSGMTSKWSLVYNPLDNTYDASNSAKVLNHTKFVQTDDDVFMASKEYFRYEYIYTYYRTAAERVKEGVQYYSLEKNALTDTTEYVPVSLAPNHLISDYVSGIREPHCKNGVYERALYRKVPKLLVAGEDYEVGTPISDKTVVFEVDGGTFSEDDRFLMPNQDNVWVNGTLNCHSVKQILEPSDGLITWVGTANLSKYNAKSVKLSSILKKSIQDILDISTIKGLTVRLFDRKMNKIVTRHADIGYCDAEYVKATGTAVEGVIYYRKTGAGTPGKPFRYSRKLVSPGTDLSSADYYTLQSPEMVFGQIIFDLLDLCGSMLNVFKDEKTGLVKFNFFNYVGTDSHLNQRFDIRQIELHF